MREIDFTVMNHAFATHRKLGRLCDEAVYQTELLGRLQKVGIEASMAVPVLLSHRQFSTCLELDLVVEQKVIYELKTVNALTAVHKGQLLGYLFLTNSTRGKLINFRLKSVESQFVNTTLDDRERKRYSLQFSQFSGDDQLAKLILELIEDWGTGLDASLYRRAILHGVNGEAVLERMVPMRSGERSIGKQRFHLLDRETALAVTTFPEPHDAHIEDFQKLLKASPLCQLHWLNVTHEQVSLYTLRR